MPLDWSALERKLLNEQKKCDDHIFIGGLETFLQTGLVDEARNSPPDDLERVGNVVAALQGYRRAEPAARYKMLATALDIIRAPNSTSAGVSKADPERSAPLADAARDDEYALDDGEDDDDGLALPGPARGTPSTRATNYSGARAYGLDASVQKLQNVGPARAAKLAKLGIYTVQDLLYHFPHRYDDYSQLKTISQLMYGEEVTLLLTVCEAKTRPTRGGKVITNVLLADPTGTIQVTFFNQRFLQDQFKSGRRVVISGQVDADLGRPTFRHPEWEPLTKELLNTARIVPVYRLTEGLTNRWLRHLIYDVVDYWAPRLPDTLPESVRAKHGLCDLPTALREIHFPTSWDKMQAARRRLAFEEFLWIQIGVLRQRRKWREQPGQPLQVNPAVVDDFIARLPFQLTGAQRRALDGILGDIRQSQPMSRLLQGDVGSGKTVVAAAAMRIAVANHAQAAVLAPTEILAGQHFNTLSRLFAGQNINVELLTGSLKSKEKEKFRERLKQGDIHIAVGTHALIQPDVEFDNLALAIIDEQHRFGVEQRGVIRAKGYNPHILVMSATPIPRTLALTVYGDLDLSIIDEMPPGRQDIKTKWLEPRERERAYSFIRTQVTQGRQAFVICPLIEESETIDAKAAVEEYERLSTVVFPDLHVGLIHGKLKAVDKDRAMNGFRDHQTHILVATSVVEVGIDVPNATVMLIEGADRFGLAQLHQFRGRVGRGEHQSYCLLLAEKSGATSDERLKVIESSQDGFRLAEEDLKLRGPGEFFGTRQSGLPDLKIAKLSDVRYLEQARGAAEEIFASDPDLQLPDHALLARQVDQFWQGKGDLS